MALQTKTFSIGSLTDKSVLNGYLLELTVIEKTTDTTKNMSAVDFVLKLRSGSKNRFNLYGIGASVSLDGKVVGSRDRYKESQVSLGYNSSVTLVSGSTTIAHGDDGTKTMAVAFSIDMATGSYVPGPASVTGKAMTLTTIPRASTTAASDANIGSVSTVVVGRKSSAFTHTVAVKFGSITGYLNADGQLVAAAEKLTAATIPFTVPESFYEEIPDKASEKCTITCTTYSGTATIGTKTVQFTVTASKDLCAPDVTISVKDVNEDTLDLTGDEKTLVRFFSTARCYVSAEALNSASMVSLTVADQTVEGDHIDFPNTEQDAFTAAATDSRGYIAKATATANLIPYVKLTCNVSAKRISPTGGDAKVTVKGNYYNGSFGAENNALALSCRVGDGEYLAFVPTITEDGYTAEIILEGLDYTQSHTIEILAEDCLMSVSKTVTVNPGIPVFDWGKNDFAFHVPISIQGNTMEDFVVEQGTVDTWTYRKWQSGLAECWYRKQFTADVTTPLGSLYTSGVLEVTNAVFPFPFQALPSVTADLSSMGYNGFLSPGGSSLLTVKQTGTYQILRPTEATGATYRISYHVVGRWK